MSEGAGMYWGSMDKCNGEVVRLIKLSTMKAWGLEMSLRILTLSTRLSDDQLHTPVALPFGLQPQYALDRELGEPKNSFQRYGETKYLLPLSGIDSLVVCPWHSRYTD
jgi:hypothetical protein